MTNQEKLLILSLLALFSVQCIYFSSDGGLISLKTTITLLVVWIAICLYMTYQGTLDEKQRKQLLQELELLNRKLKVGQSNPGADNESINKKHHEAIKTMQLEMDSILREKCSLQKALEDVAANQKIENDKIRSQQETSQQIEDLREESLLREYEYKLKSGTKDFEHQKGLMRKEIEDLIRSNQKKSDAISILKKDLRTQQETLKRSLDAEISRKNREIMKMNEEKQRDEKEHKEELAVVRRDHRVFMTRQQWEYERKLRQLTLESESKTVSHKSDIDKLQSQNESKLDALKREHVLEKERIYQNNQHTMDKMRQDHKVALQDLQSNLKMLLADRVGTTASILQKDSHLPAISFANNEPLLPQLTDKNS